MTRPFAWQPRLFTSLAAFRQHLADVDMDWCEGLTLHHTYRPTREQWHGLRTMRGLKTHYRQVEGGTWDSGPHLFLAPDGIWQGTPLYRPGIHAGRCNRDHVGVEVVGDYDREPWSREVRSLVFGVADALLDRLGLPVTWWTVNGHRECLANKTCPGRMVDMHETREALNRYRASIGLSVSARATYRVLEDGARIRTGPGTSFPVVATMAAGTLFFSDGTQEGETAAGTNVWVHYAGPDMFVSAPRGFVNASLVEMV